MAPTSWPAGGRVGSTLWPGSSSTMSPRPRSARSTPRGSTTPTPRSWTARSSRSGIARRRWPSRPTGRATSRRTARRSACCGRRVASTSCGRSREPRGTPIRAARSTSSATGCIRRTASSCSSRPTRRCRAATSRSRSAPSATGSTSRSIAAAARARSSRTPRGPAPLTIGTARDAAAGTATIEFTIAAPELVAALRPGARLPLGLDRMEGKAPRQYLMAFPARTAKPNFHAPTGFGVLVVDP
jgi:hypothetical protein